MPTLVQSPGEIIHPSHPINWSHPLNNGRLFWGLVLPTRGYSDKFYDLCGHHHCDFRTAGNRSTDWNSGQIRRGGWGNLRCTVADTGCRVETLPLLELALPFTLAIWFQSIGPPTSNSSVFGITHNTTGASPFVSAALAAASITNVYFMSNSSGTFYSENTSPTIAWSSLTLWTRIVVTATTAARRFYINGVYHSQNTTTRTSPTYGATASVLFGEQYSSSRSCIGRLDDGSIWNRALSDDEVMCDYKLGLSGYPGVLRRIGMKRYSEQAAVGGTGNPWFYYSLLGR
jgi:hypothetical protein